ncbi:MAG: PKD domain-containing protein, partial [Bacteroidia bacterium]|nr:PKD domain-containing protein [Bacteroidia bacterium]
NGPNSFIVDCRITTGGGGIGGNGGNGGSGGAAGSGGAGGNGYENCGDGDAGDGGQGGNGRAGAAGNGGGRGLNGPSHAIANVDAAAGAFSLANAPTVIGFGCTLNSDPTCGSVPNPPYVITVEHLEGCTHSEIALAHVAGNPIPGPRWRAPGGNILRSSSDSTITFVWYPSQGWYTIERDEPPTGAGGTDVTYTEFIHILTNRQLPGIRSLYNGVPSRSVCAGDFLFFEREPAPGRFGDANTLQWEWEFPGGSINPAGDPVPASVRSLPSPGAIYYLTPGVYPVILRVRDKCCGWSRPIVDTIFVMPNPQVTISGPSEVCGAGPIPPGTFQATAYPGPTTTPPDPNPEFRWYVNGIPQTFAWVPQSSGGHLFPSGPLTLNDGDIIKVEVRSSAPLYCNDPTVSFATKRITVSSPSVGGFAYINAPGITSLYVCPGEQHTVGVVGQSSGPNVTYQWQVSTDGGATWTDVVSAITPTFLTAPIVINGTQYRVRIKNGSCAPAFSTPVTFYLNAGVNPGVASVDPNTDTICAGSSANLSVVGFSGQIVWQYTTTPWIATSWVNTSYTAPNITFPSLTQTSYFRVRAYNPGGGPCSEAFSNIVEVVVRPNPVAGTILVNPNPVCAGSNVLLTLSSYTGTQIQWQQLVGSSWVNVGPNSDSWSAGPITSTSFFRALVYNEGCGPVISPVATISLIPGTSYGVNLTVSQNPACAGQPVTFTAIPVGSPPSPTFQFYLVRGATTTPVTGSGSTYTTSSLLNGDQIYVEMQVTSACGSGTFTSNTITMQVNPQPTVSITGPGSVICQGSSVTFTATPTPATATVQWYVNGSFTGVTGNSFTTNSLNDGDEVYAVATLAGCTSLPSNRIRVDVDPAPSIVISADRTSVCEGEAIHFTATTFNAGAFPTYQWQVNTGAGWTNIPGATGSTYHSTTLTNGSVIRCLVFPAGTGCTGSVASNPITVTIHPIPTVSITASTTTICEGQTVIFNASATNGGPTPTYQWYVNGNPVGTNSPVYVSSSLQNGDIVYCVVTSSAGCSHATLSRSNSITMTVHPVPRVVVSPMNPEVCAGQSVQFNAIVTGGSPAPLTYTWYVNGAPQGVNSPSFGPVVLPNGAQVTCQVTTAAGCQSTVSAPSVVTVRPVPVVTISASSNTVCAGQPVTFTASVTNGGPSPIYDWQVNGTSQGINSTIFTYTPNHNDEIRCIVSNGTGCTSAPSNTIRITVNPIPSVTISASPSTTVCDNTPITFTATATDAGPSPTYQWYLNGNPVGPNAPTFILTNPQNGDAVRVRVTSTAGCTGAASLSNAIVVSAHPPVEVQIQASANPICIGQTVLFTSTVNNAGANPTYQWQVNGVNVPGATGPTFVTSTLNHGDAVRLLVTSTQGCPVGGRPSNTIVMTVNSAATITLSQSPSGRICRGTRVIFTANGAPAGSTFSWSLNGNPLPGVVNATYVTDTLRNGDIVAVYITYQGCRSNTASITAQVVDGPTADFTVPSPRCVNEPYSFQSTVSGGAGLTYAWDFGPNATPSASTLPSPSGIVFSAPGPQTVTLTVTDPATGCATRVTKTVQVKPKPQARIAPVPNVCLGTPQSFSQVGVTDPGAVFIWNFLPDGQPGTVVGPTATGITFPTPGNKTARLIVVVDGCTDTAQVTFRVDSTLRVDLGPDRTLCPADLPITLDAGPGGQLYEWTRNGQPIGGNTQTLTVTQAGIYAVRVTTATGCVGQDAVNIQVSSQIPVDLGPDLTLCASGGTSVVLRSGYPGATHIWTFNGQPIPGATADTLLVTQPGTYGVTVQPAGSSCRGQDFVVVRVDSTITVSLGPDVFYCTTDPIQPLTAPSVGGATYVWYRNGATIPGANGPSITPTISGTYVVVVLAGSCIGSDTVQVTISPNVQVQLPDTLRYCATNPLIRLEAPYYPGATYLWTLNGTSVAQGVGLYRIIDTRGGIWRVSITTAGGCSGSATTVADAVPNPRPDFETEPALPARLTLNSPGVRFINTSRNTLPQTRFLWNFGDGNTSTARDPVHRYTRIGTYYVTLYMMNGDCMDSVRKGPIVVTSDEGTFVPTAFSPNGDGINDQLYFIPVGYTDYELFIYNRWGMLVFYKKLGETKFWDGYEEEGGVRRPAPEGAYVWVFKGIKDTGERETLTGTVTLTR